MAAVDCTDIASLLDSVTNTDNIYTFKICRKHPVCVVKALRRDVKL